MRKFINYLFVSLALLFCLNVRASTSTLYVNLENFKYSVDGKKYSDIKSYDNLSDFLDDYNAGNLPELYVTNFLFDGVSTVKSPDLDDFIDDGTNDTKIKTLEINVLNINTTGDIELTGKTTGTMIGVNTNNVKGNINLILNNVNIDTDTKKAPAIFVYNKDITYTDCKVTIKTAKNSKNYIEGGKFKKVSLMPSDKLEDYESYYSGDNLTNYKKYSSYYGIYTSSQLDDILFATVRADNEDLQDGDPYSFYKGSGAISSDIDLYFEGEGYLKVTSKNKEGIETKGNLTLSGGTGDYEIYAHDDCLNTTTASSSGDNVRNTMTIDVNSLVAIVSDDGDEGDAIDSNGTLTINGGKIYAFAHSTSQDSGLDSDGGTYINGGTIIATGNMADMISNESKQKSLYIRFNSKIEKGTLIVIKDKNDKIITAFETGKDITTFLYSSEDLSYSSVKVYTGGEIDGEEENGLYTTINNYNNGKEISFNIVNSTDSFERKNNSISTTLLITLLVECGLLILLLVYIYFDKKKLKNC